MTEEAKTPVLLDDVVVMGRIKKLMAQLNPDDYDIVSRWICDKYSLHGVAKFTTAAAAHLNPPRPAPAADL